MIFPGPEWRLIGGYRSIILVAAMLAVAAGAGADSEPLYVKNLSPVAGLFGLPSQRVAAIQTPKSVAVALHSSVASHYVSEFDKVEGLNLDGETLRFALEVRYGLAENWDVQVEVPWLEHSAGNLDSLIDSWHSLWGFTDGGRSDAPRNVLDYRYAGPEARFAMLDDASGLGDVSVALSHGFYTRESSAASLVLGYKFATGEERDFLGSGAEDGWLALRFSGEHLTDLPLSWHGQLGYLRAGKSELLGDAQERDLWFAGLTMDWAVADAWSILVQLDAHGAPADSKLTALGDEAILLSLGARWAFAPRWSVDLNFIEDVRVETAPDVTFQASLRYFGGR
ncbi:MAG: DUF3187 family protein [Halioglobus sp.]